MSDKDKVIERLLKRKNGANDKYKIGLIVEGGGMRGTFSGGVMIGLEKLGLSKCFDVIYASSSGSCAATYLLAGQAIEGTEIYYNQLDGRKFINPIRLNKIMDLDYLFDEVMTSVVPLDVDKVRKSKTLLKIFVSEAETGRPVCFTNRSDCNLLKIMKASCALPIFYDRPVEINGYKSMDGNVMRRVPIEEAITDGCTDVLVVTTVPRTYREPFYKDFNPFKQLLMYKHHKNFKNAHKNRSKQYNQSLDVVFGREKVYREINIFAISPDYKFFEAETNKDKLYLFAKHGLNKVRSAFKEGVHEKVNN